MKVEFVNTHLSLRARFVIAFFFYIFAALLHIFLVKMERSGDVHYSIHFFWLCLLFIPLRFLKAKNFSNKPEPAAELHQSIASQMRGSPPGTDNALSGGTQSEQTGTWKTVSMTELARFRDKLGTLKRIKIPLVYSRSFAIIVTVIFFVFGFGLFTYFTLLAGGQSIAVFAFYLIFFPFLWYARVDKWVPEISGKIDALDPVIDSKLPKNIQLLTMFFFDTSDEAIPSDIRLMLAPGTGVSQDIRDELMGAQFQVTYNNGPNGPVPYVYAVFITKGMGKIWNSLKNFWPAGYITEPGSSTEGKELYGTVVLRLNTKSRSDGYHSKESDVQELLGLVLVDLEKALFPRKKRRR